MESHYETVVGLEVHVQLNTNTKQFCSDANVFGEDANKHTSSISLAHPGTLPRINSRTLQNAIKLAYAIGAEINHENRFDRKHYFYADLPKGYQITQDKLPYCVGGSLTLDSGKIIRFHHIHMEEDAGKSIHHLKQDVSCIDLNRAGVPLLEIVTEPDLSSGKEVHEFMGKLQQLIRYLDISDGNMEQGSMRCDCNVSVRPKGETRLGERCEIKNLNSKKFAMQAVEYEAKRQIQAVEAGKEITVQTMHFDSINGTTSPTRDKESAHDYRYFPDPDLPPIILGEDVLEKIKSEMPPLPEAIKKLLKEDYKLTEQQAQIITKELEVSSYFLSLAKDIVDIKSLANLFVNTLIPYKSSNDLDLSKLNVSTKSWNTYIELVKGEKVNRADASTKLFPSMIENPTKDIINIAKELDILQSNDGDLSMKIVAQVLATFPEEVARYKAGKKALIGFFVGESMKAAKGKSNPKTLKTLLEKELNT